MVALVPASSVTLSKLLNFSVLCQNEMAIALPGGWCEDLDQRPAPASSSRDRYQPSPSSKLCRNQPLEKVAQSFTDKIFETRLEWKSGDSGRIKEHICVCWVGGGHSALFFRSF